MTSLRALGAADRIRAIADANDVALLPSAGRSPHLAQYGITARDDDGVIAGRARVHGHAVFVAAQDETFIGGTAGARHAATLAALFERARIERPAAVVLLVASGGVRLHEANPAELALARALGALLDARAAGVPVLALGVGDVFGGVSVLAASADRLALFPRTRFGVSAAKVIEAATGKTEIDSDDDEAVRMLFGAEARAAAGLTDLVADDADVVRTWIVTAMRAALPFSEAIAAMHARLAVRLTDVRRTEAFAALPASVSAFVEAKRVDAAGALWKMRAADVYLTRPCGKTTFGPASAWALDDALLARLDWGSPQSGTTLVVVEDSTGHEATRRAEAVGLAQFLAHHAAVLARLRARGHHVLGLLVGNGAGAAFFVNALQGSQLYSLDGARVVAMSPQAIARVTGQDAAALSARIESDPLVGHPVRQFASWGGVARILERADAQAILDLAQAL